MRRHNAGVVIGFGFLVVACLSVVPNVVVAEECSLKPVYHVLDVKGCMTKTIPSFTCQGRCSSYVQVSGSKIWQLERSCNCCQESGEREATVALLCYGDQKIKWVSTKAPLACMCRPCSTVEGNEVKAQEIVNFVQGSGFTGFNPKT